MRYRSVVLIGLLVCSVAVLSMVLSVPSTRATVSYGGTNFTMTSYNSIGGITTPDYYTTTNNWLYWKVNIKNNSGGTKGYVVQADSVYIQWKKWGGSWISIDTKYTPQPALRSSIHVKRNDNSVGGYENVITANDMPGWLPWGWDAGPGINNGDNDNFWVTINTTAFANFVSLWTVPTQFLVAFDVYDNDSTEDSMQGLLLDFYVYPQAAVTTDIRAVADTYVTSSATGTNYAAATLLEASGSVKYAYAKFPLTVPANWGVQSAALRYYIDVAGTEATRYLYLTATDWAENVLTYTNMETYALTGGLIGSYPFVVGWNTVDVSAAIRDNIAKGLQYISFKFTAAVSTPVLQIRSKEYGDGSYAPYLMVEYLPMPTVLYPKFGLGSFICPNATTVRITNSLTSMGNENNAHLYLQYQTNDNHTDHGWVSGYYIEQSITTLSAPGSFTAVVGGLVENMYYWCRWREYGSMTQLNVISNDMRWLQQTSNYGGENQPSHVTLATIETAAATAIDNTHATLNATLHMSTESRSIAVYFLISTDTDLSSIEENIYVGNYLMVGGMSSDQLISLQLPTSDFTLTPSTTYYFKAELRISDAGGIIYGYSTNGWFVFETPATNPLPEIPTHYINIGSLPDIVGDYLFGGTSGTNGVSTQHDVGGIFIVLIVTITILVVLAKVKVPSIGIIGVLIILMGFFTYLAWVPLWIGFIIGLGFSLWLAEKVVSHGK